MCILQGLECIRTLRRQFHPVAGPDKFELDGIIEDMNKVGLKVTVEGNISDFLGVQIERKPDGTIHLTQPHLIDQILENLRLNGPDVATNEYTS